MFSFKKKDDIVYSVIAIGIISLIFWKFYLPLTDFWFFSDDTHWIYASSKRSFCEILFSPLKYRGLANNFTPLLGISIKLDWTLFKLNFIGYQFHNYIILGLLCLSFYFLLRHFAEQRIWALWGTILLLLNPITLALTSWISTRHYIEGAFWSVLSFLSYRKGKNLIVRDCLTQLFFMLACLNKEVYVILPVFLFLFSKENFLKRLTDLKFFIVSLSAYSIWRFYILGGMGGYPGNEKITILNIIPLVFKTFSFLAIHLSSHFYIFIIFLLILLILAIYLCGVKKTLSILGILMVSFLPLIPVSNLFSNSAFIGRYFFCSSLLLIISLIGLSGKVFQDPLKKISIGYLIILVFFTVSFAEKSLSTIKNITSSRSAYKKEALDFVNSNQSYINPLEPLWFYDSLKRIYKDHYRKEIKTFILPPSKFLPYMSEDWLIKIKDMNIDIPYEKIKEKRKFFRPGPIEIEFKIDNYNLEWKFGPYKTGTYEILRSDESGLYYYHSLVPWKGNHRFGAIDHPVYFKIVYHLQNGHEIISPEFELKIPSKEVKYFKSGSQGGRS